jgi:hypothetical protein
MLSVIMLCDVMPSVIMLKVVIPTVVAPSTLAVKQGDCIQGTPLEYLDQGALTKGEGSVQLTSSLR